MMRSVIDLRGSTSGSVAPTVALSMVGLIAVGGIAFDYARIATLDTELQQAADQAALAAATQLDGGTDACKRAAAAARDLLNNQTVFANDGSADGTAVIVASEAACDATGQVRFYKSYDEVNDQPGEAAANDAEAKFVVITVDSRGARYALTPVVDAIAGETSATAIATLGAGAICKIPPLMMCNPNEGAGGSFPTASDIGKGLKLEAGGGGTWAPGNYGYLDFGPDASSLEAAMGANVESQPCVAASQVKTKPGNVASAPAGINTRFDIYDNGLVAACAQGSGKCSPAMNVIKDVIHPQFTAGTPPNEIAAVATKGKGGGSADNCALANGTDPWVMPTVPYVPDITTRTQATAPTSMGHPRDICHAVSFDGDCPSGRFGNGNWDRNLYFKVNYGAANAAEWQGYSWLTSWAATHGVTVATISRYNVYRAEAAALGAGTIESRRKMESAAKGKGKDLYSYRTPRCEPGKAATETIKDRRLLTAALVNCTAGNVKGSSSVSPIGWVDLFLVEPSAARTHTSASQIYVEVAGVGTKPNGDANTFQYFLRQRPRLVK